MHRQEFLHLDYRSIKVINSANPSVFLTNFTGNYATILNYPLRISVIALFNTSGCSWNAGCCNTGKESWPIHGLFIPIMLKRENQRLIFLFLIKFLHLSLIKKLVLFPWIRRKSYPLFFIYLDFLNNGIAFSECRQEQWLAP